MRGFSYRTQLVRMSHMWLLCATMKSVVPRSVVAIETNMKINVMKIFNAIQFNSIRTMELTSLQTNSCLLLQRIVLLQHYFVELLQIHKNFAICPSYSIETKALHLFISFYNGQMQMTLDMNWKCTSIPWFLEWVKFNGKLNNLKT